MKNLLPLFFIASAATTFANDLEYSGSLWTNLWTDWAIDSTDQFTSPENYNNTDFYLNTTYKMDLGLSASVGFYAGSQDKAGNNGIPLGRTEVADWDNQINEITIDTYSANWEVAENGVVGLGRYLYSFGGVDNYYPYSYATTYSSVLAERYITGFGLMAGGVEAYIGIPGTKNRSISFYATYPIELMNSATENFTIQPMLEYTSNQGRSRNFNVGAKYHYSSGNDEYQYALDGTMSMMPYKGSTTYTLLTEPSFKMGAFSVGLGYYHAFLADNSVAAGLQTDLPDKQFFYVEPLIEVNDILSFGLPYSWHDRSENSYYDEAWLGGANIYVYPTENVELKFFANYVLNHGPFHTFSESGDSFMTGFEAHLEF